MFNLSPQLLAANTDHPPVLSLSVSHTRTHMDIIIQYATSANDTETGNL